MAVFARAPVPGAAKTRLIPALGAARAAALHADLVRHTLDTCSAAGFTRVDLWCAPDMEHEFFAECARRPGVHLRAQQGEDLGQRMLHAFDLSLRECGTCVLVGSDQGRTGYRKEIEDRIRMRGLESVVRIVDHCRDMPAAYMLADVVVSASTDPEAFGRVVAEAQAMGRPVVAPEHGAAPEILLPGETGWLFAPSDPAALATALDLALKLDASEREVRARTAIAHVRERFTRAGMCNATLDVYREVLAEAASPVRFAASR